MPPSRKAVSKGHAPDLVNRADDILAVLADYPSYADVLADSDNGTTSLGVLPLTGDIIAGLGLAPCPSSRASVSRSLARMVSRGQVVGLRGQIYTQGKGQRWARDLTAPARDKIERERNARIIAAREAGETQRQIAAREGMSHVGVGKVLGNERQSSVGYQPPPPAPSQPPPVAPRAFVAPQQPSRPFVIPQPAYSQQPRLQPAAASPRSGRSWSRPRREPSRQRSSAAGQGSA